MQGSAHTLAAALLSLNSELACVSQQLHIQRQQFEVRRANVQAVNACQAQCTYLDVGGQLFHASWDALQRHGPHYLSALTSGMFAECGDESGYTFVDRDPHWFALVLAYLRDGMLCRPSARRALRSLQREALFYAVPQFQRQVILEECLITITTVGCHLHIYEPELGRWLPLREPLQADADAVLQDCFEYGQSFMVRLCSPDDLPVLRRLDIATWTWEPVPVPDLSDPITNICNMIDLNGHLLLLGRQERSYTLQVIDGPAWAWSDDYGIPHLFIMDNHVAILFDTDLLPAGQENTFVVYEDGCWKHLPPRPPQVMRFACVTGLEDRVVVTEMDLPGRLVQQYIFSEARWQALPKMQEPRAGCEVLLWQGKLVVLGGNSGPTFTVEAYDSAAGQWVAWPSLPFTPDQSWAGGIVFEEELLVFGWSPDVVIRYNSQSHSWRPMWHFNEQVYRCRLLTLPRSQVLAQAACPHP